MKAVVAAFNQEKALVGAFSVIVQPVVEPMDRFTALIRMANLTNNVTDAAVTLLRKRSVEEARDSNTVHIARIQEEEPDILLLDRQQNITVNIFGNST